MCSLYRVKMKYIGSWRVLLNLARAIVWILSVGIKSGYVVPWATRSAISQSVSGSSPDSTRCSHWKIILPPKETIIKTTNTKVAVTYKSLINKSIHQTWNPKRVIESPICKPSATYIRQIEIKWKILYMKIILEIIKSKICIFTNTPVVTTQR